MLEAGPLDIGYWTEMQYMASLHVDEKRDVPMARLYPVRRVRVIHYEYEGYFLK